ncbi:MAG: pyrroline-5-carboxylate reductase [Acidobacteriota bacterium]
MDDVKIGRLAVIGAGKMGETLISALAGSGVVDSGDVVATAKHPERLAKLEESFHVGTTLDNAEAAAGAEVILLCVKPQVAPAVIEELGPHLDGTELVLSIVAGLTTETIERHLGREAPVVRAMPNTPSRIGCGMTAVCGGRWATAQHVELGRALFSGIGRSLVLDEKYFDAVTGLSASGPAFIYIVIEAMAEGGVKLGLPRAVATELAAQTCLGAGHMVIDKGAHPALLKDEVTTPAGCTIDGILKLEEGGLRVTLIKAIVEAGRRAKELVDG